LNTDAKYDPEIFSLIPQRPPFVMIDRFLGLDEKSGSSAFKITEGNIFVENGAFTEPGLIENIAQTAAARIGYICKTEKKPVLIGYIGAVQNLEIFALPKINDEIKTEIAIKNEIFNVTIIGGKILCEGKLLAHCEMKIFISNQQ
jgi:3-hydroxymyristoyl/3-hydroxydecanoyl-(acyl carrier protein) dehydratase